MEKVNFINYRNRHHKCKWCQYYKHNVEDIGTSYFIFNKCLLKDKNIKYPSLPTLCKYYINNIERRNK